MVFWVWLLDPIIVAKNTIRLVLRWNFPGKTQGLTFFRSNLYGRYPKDVKFQNSEYFFWFLDPKIVTKSVIRFVPRGNLLYKADLNGSSGMVGSQVIQIQISWSAGLLAGEFKWQTIILRTHSFREDCFIVNCNFYWNLSKSFHPVITIIIVSGQ
jgi:hypothetical protein